MRGRIDTTELNKHDLLAAQIEKYLYLCVKLFWKNLKFKHHIAIYYPEKILGLDRILWNIWSMRFESKHREDKTIAHSVISSINICYTVALRQCNK